MFNKSNSKMKIKSFRKGWITLVVIFIFFPFSLFSQKIGINLYSQELAQKYKKNLQTDQGYNKFKSETLKLLELFNKSIYKKDIFVFKDGLWENDLSLFGFQDGDIMITYDEFYHSIIIGYILDGECYGNNGLELTYKDSITKKDFNSLLEKLKNVRSINTNYFFVETKYGYDNRAIDKVALTIRNYTFLPVSQIELKLTIESKDIVLYRKKHTINIQLDGLGIATTNPIKLGSTVYNDDFSDCIFTIDIISVK